MQLNEALQKTSRLLQGSLQSLNKVDRVFSFQKSLFRQILQIKSFKNLKPFSADSNIFQLSEFLARCTFS